ncbi:MAG: phage minor head protein [Pleomorphochaeta sp.]
MLKLYDSLYKEAQIALASILENEEREIIKAYGTAIYKTRKELKTLYDKYSRNGKLSNAELSKYNRLTGIQNQIEGILNKETSGIGPMIDKLTSLQREESFYRHGYAMDQGGTIGLNWGQFNEDAIKSAVNNKLSKISASDLLEEARPEFLNQIRNEISLSTIRGDSYTKLSQRIEQILGVSVVGGKDAIYKGVGIAARALRIARTEGQRALVEGQLASYQRAEDIGCEIEEIWDATLDGKTRPEHGELDGQAKDTEKGGWLVPKIGIVTGPLQSGVASFDINCRCRVRGQVKGYPPTKRTYRDENDNTVLGEYKTYKEWKAEQISNVPIKKYKKAVKTKRNYNSDLSQKIGTEHYNKIHNILDNCKDKKVIKLWEKYEDKVYVGSTNIAPNKAHYAPYSNKINFNLLNTAKGSDYEAKYQTLFHESGHAIDRAINRAKGLNRMNYSLTYKNGLFPNTIEKEVNDRIEMINNNLKTLFKAHKNDYEWLYKNGMLRKHDYDNWKITGQLKKNLRYSEKYAYRKLQKEITNIPLDCRGNLSDIMEGATYAKIKAGVGHGASYWKKFKINDTNNGLAAEAFAEMIDATISNEKNLDSILKYFPESYKLFKKMIEEVL